MIQREKGDNRRKCPLLEGDKVPLIYCDIAPCFSLQGGEGCRYKHKCGQSLIGWSDE